MSRVGKNPVVLPDGVEAMIAGRQITIKGKMGELAYTVPYAVEFKQEEKEISFAPRNKTKDAQAMWGTARALTANMVQGVSEGFQKKLEIKGVGYRAAVQGNKLNLTVGYSHPVNMDIPQGLQVKVDGNTELTVTGADKQVLGQFCAEVRAVRPPEPYKGKGIRYADEFIFMKEGKKK